MFSNSQMCLSLWLTALECVFSNEDHFRNLYVKFLTRHQHQREMTYTYMLSPERFFYRKKYDWQSGAGCGKLGQAAQATPTLMHNKVFLKKPRFSSNRTEPSYASCQQSYFGGSKVEGNIGYSQIAKLSRKVLTGCIISYQRATEVVFHTSKILSILGHQLPHF